MPHQHAGNHPYTYVVSIAENAAGTPSIQAWNTASEAVEFAGPDAAAVLNQTFGPGHAVLVKSGEYDITAPLEITKEMLLEFEPNALLWVPSGYDQYVIGLGDAVADSVIRGGFVRESGEKERLWDGIRLHEHAGGPGLSGVAANSIEDMKIWDCRAGIRLLVAHPDGWINGNVFRDIRMYRPDVAIDFDVPLPPPLDSSATINRNLFENIVVQCGYNTTVGVSAIRHRANVFVDTKIWDIDKNPDASTATIHPAATGTMILGGIMTKQNFVDDGQETQIIDSWSDRQLTLNRLHVRGGAISLFDAAGSATIVLDAETGVITAPGGADVAEVFPTTPGQHIAPGSVVSINRSSGRVELSTGAYETRVLGVAAGAADLQPGLVLGAVADPADGEVAVALAGRAWCLADTSNGPIEVGDLLTTSTETGQAMRAGDPRRAWGAVIGKALDPLPSGAGLVRILIATG